MKINLPLYVELKRKTMPPKKYMINLNNYRNWNYIVSNNIKKEYKNKVLDALPIGFGSCLKVRLIFTLYKSSNRRIDRANILSITEKFFCDALVELGFLPDDNDMFIQESIYRSGEVDKNNPRVEVDVQLL